MRCAVRYAVISVSDDSAASIITDAGGAIFLFQTSVTMLCCVITLKTSVNLLTWSLRINWALQRVITHVDFQA